MATKNCPFVRVVLVLGVIALATAQQLVHCDDAMCCEHSVGEYIVASDLLDDALLPRYGSTKIGIGTLVKNLPTESRLCGDVPAFHANDDDLLADKFLLYQNLSGYCREQDTALTTGTPYLGLSARDSVTIALSFGTTPPLTVKEEQFCESEGATTCPMARKIPDIVVAINKFQFSTLQRRDRLPALLEQAKLLAQDPENARKIQRASPSATPGIIRDIYAPIIDGFRINTGSEDALAELLVSLNASEAMYLRWLPAFANANSKCNRVTVRTDDNIAWHAACSQKSLACPDAAEARFVGVSCLFNPAAEPGGLSRLGTTDPNACILDDIATVVRQRTNAESRYIKLSDHVFGKWEEELRAKSGPFYRQFELGGLFRSTHIQIIPPQPVPELEPTQCPRSHLVSDLPGFASVSGDAVWGQTKMVYAFEGDLTRHHCSEPTTFGNDHGAMLETCASFCGAGAIPLLVGTAASPVSVETMVDVCFARDVVQDSTELAFCEQGAAAFHELLDMLVAFSADVYSLQFGKVAYMDLVSQLMDLFSEVASNELQDIIQNASPDDIPGVMREFLKREYSFIENKKTSIQFQTHRVKKSSDALFGRIPTLIADMERYRASCSGGLYPRSAGNQTVLALCPVMGSECADTIEETWTYCCCGRSVPVENVFVDARDAISEIKNISAPIYLMAGNAVNGTAATRRSSGNAPHASWYQAYNSAMLAKWGAAAFDPPVLARTSSSDTSPILQPPPVNPTPGPGGEGDWLPDTDAKGGQQESPEPEPEATPTPAIMPPDRDSSAWRDTTSSLALLRAMVAALVLLRSLPHW